MNKMSIRIKVSPIAKDFSRFDSTFLSYSKKNLFQNHLHEYQAKIPGKGYDHVTLERKIYVKKC